MQIPLQITYIHMYAPDGLDDIIREHVAQLEQRFGRIMSCRVVVEAPHKHHRKGTHYHCRIDLTIPRKEIVVSREPPLNKAHEDVFVAIRDAFRVARRRLEEHSRRHRGRIRAREVCPHGTIMELWHGRDYGSIETADGHAVYFHRHSIINADYDHLKIGDQVRFCVEDGDSGPQASSVHLIGKHHRAAV